MIFSQLRADGEVTPVSTTSKGKKIFLMTFGSRGDTQPMLALAMHLRASGFQILISTNIDHASFFESSGFDVRGFHFNMKDFMTSKSMCARAGHLHRTLLDAHSFDYVLTQVARSARISGVCPA